ncbi:MAG: tRNA lysidine(34) synthetase TilS [Betaproteobacteria bacterium]
MARAGERPVVAWPRGTGGEGTDPAVCVGFSGGLDSTVLLHLLHAQAQAGARRLTAVHVHHGLSPNADRWADLCRASCARLGVPLDVARVKLDRASGLGVEAEARRARYEVFASRPEPIVALAHQRDDQAETVLLQLLRGTGLKGVAAMPVLRALNDRVALYRPLLGCTRAQLERYARDEGLAWIEDESNAATTHDRNFLRHEIAPRLEARFPTWRESLARFATHAAQAQRLLEELAALDGLPSAPGVPVPLDSRLSEARRANLLRAFLALNDLAMPGEARLAEMARQLFEAREDAQVRLEHDGEVITRHHGSARIGPPAPPPSWRVAWRGEPEVALGEALGAVRFEPATGEGLRADRAREEGWFFAPRAGGERIRLAPGRPTRTLKNLLQERDVAPGERARLPLLFHGGDLVWVPGVGIAAEYACEPGKPGLKPHWRVAGRAPLC